MKKLLVALALVLSTAIFGTTACETKPVDKSSSSSSVEQSVSSSSNEETSSPEDSSSAEEPSNPGTSSPENSSSAEDTSSSVEDSSSEEEKTFTVTLLNEDGTEFKVIENVPEGTTAEVIYGEDYIPTKEGYIFDGWDFNGYTVKETDEVTQDLTLKAKFVASTYTITWIVEGATSTTDGIYDQKPVFEGETPTKAGDDKYVSYNFIGWTDGETTYAPNELPVVTGVQTYTAVFEGGEKQIYTITWVIDEYDERTSEIAYGEKTVYDGDAFTKEGDAQYVSYNFVGWKVGETIYAPDELPVVTGEQTYTAVFEGGELQQYTITWLNKDGTELSSGKVAYGTVPSYDGTPTFAPTAQFTYNFESWDKEVVAVVGDATYTAVYEEIVNKYTITWVNEDGSVLETDTEVEYGATPTYNGQVPTKVADANYTYTFNAWSPEIAEVVGDATYTATYTAEGKLYTVNWVIGEKTLTSSVEYGKVPTFEGTSADLYKYGYEFIGWSDTADGEVITLPAVDGTETYYAVFSDTSVWDGTYPTLETGATAADLFDGEGTETSPYLIQSATDLAELSALTNGKNYGSKSEYFKLTINIDLSKDGKSKWVPICAPDTNHVGWIANKYFFASNFDGSNKTITFNQEFTSSQDVWAQGLFVGLDGDNTVKDIKFAGTIYAKGYTGALAGFVMGTNISGIVNTATINSYLNTGTGTATANAIMGGIVGIVFQNQDGKSYKTTFTDCINMGEVNAHKYSRNAGGLVGCIQYSDAKNGYLEVVFNNCINKGAVSGGQKTGGLTGEIEGGSLAHFNNCQNTGSVVGYTTAGAEFIPTTEVGTASPYVGLISGANASKYTVLFKVDGNTYESVTLAYGGQPSVTNPTKSDDETYRYTFAGWALTEGGEVIVLPKATQATTYYAVFTKEQLYTITWNVDGTETTSKYVAGETPEFTGSVAKEGYEFLGWATSADGEVVEIPTVSADQTYYAVFEQVTAKYTVTWVGASGTLETDTDVAHGSAPTYNAETPVKDGYVFAGWALTEGGEVVDLATQIVDKDVSYYAIFTYSIWDGTYPTLADGATAETLFEKDTDGYYLIQSAEDLATLAVLSKGAAYGSGLKFKQTVNIDLSKGGWYGICDNNGAMGGWISTATIDYGFNGEYDGNGKTIIMQESITDNHTGLFWSIKNGTVTNLTFDGSITAGSYSGILASRIAGSATISYITNNVNLTISGGDIKSTAGLIGFVCSGVTGVSISNCVNNGNITGPGARIGGIVGAVISNTAYLSEQTITISNCSNSGDITGNTAGRTYTTKDGETTETTQKGVGGIVGIMEGYNKYTVTDCSNTGEIQSLWSAAGIVGTNGWNVWSTITGCSNNGNVTVTSTNAGGITSYQYTNANHVGKMTNCKNSGTITAGETSLTTGTSDNLWSAASPYVGWLIGQNAGNKVDCTITTNPLD